MRTLRIAVLGRILPLLIALTLVLIATAGAYAGNARVDGVEDPILPYYARISAGEIFHDEDLAVVVFYHPPSCIPALFNLLEFYDWAALDCPMTVDGIFIWDEPWVQPLLINLHGLGAVPVWFVSWGEMQGAVADGILTIGELSALPSLMEGSASFYHEMLQPYPTIRGKIEYGAKGSLTDGRSFQVHATWIRDHEMQVDIKIR